MAEDEESFVDELGVEKTSNEIDDLVNEEVNAPKYCSITRFKVGIHVLELGEETLSWILFLLSLFTSVRGQAVISSTRTTST